MILAVECLMKSVKQSLVECLCCLLMSLVVSIQLRLAGVSLNVQVNHAFPVLVVGDNLNTDLILWEEALQLIIDKGGLAHAWDPNRQHYYYVLSLNSFHYFAPGLLCCLEILSGCFNLLSNN